MAKEIKQKIVLEGEKEYSAAIKEAHRNLKTLQSQLKAETAELGANATAQDKMTVKLRNLQKQIAEQEKLVKTYEKALEEVREKYGDNEDALASWEIKLNNARAALADMRNGLEDVGDGFRTIETDAGTAVVATKSVADSIGQLGSIGSTVADTIEGIFTGMVDTIRTALAEVWGLISETAAKANNWRDGLHPPEQRPGGAVRRDAGHQDHGHPGGLGRDPEAAAAVQRGRERLRHDQRRAERDERPACADLHD